MKKWLTAIGITFVVLSCLLAWGVVAMDYGDHVAVGTYRFRRDDHGRSSRDETIAHAMDGLQVQLVVCLDRDETHVLPADSLRDGLGKLRPTVICGEQLSMPESHPR